MASTPQYGEQVISASFALATANLNRDGVTGANVTAYTGRAAGGSTNGKGGRIDYLTLTGGVGAVLAGYILMFVNGTLVREIPTTAITPSATVKGWCIPTTEGADVNGRLPIGMLFLPGDVIKFCTTQTHAILGRLEGAEF